MFLLYCMLTFALAASVGVIVRCLVSVRREPSYSKLSAITAAILLCLMLMLIAQQTGPSAFGWFQPIFVRI